MEGAKKMDILWSDALNFPPPPLPYGQLFASLVVCLTLDIEHLRSETEVT